MASEDVQSRYKKLELPVHGFKSQLPEHILKKLSDSEQYMVEAISRIESKADWLIEQTVKENSDKIDLDKRLIPVENFRANFKAKWAVVAGLGVILLTALVEKGVSTFWAFFTKTPNP